MTTPVPSANSKAARHSTAVSDLRRLVVENAGKRLPSEREMSKQLGISRPHLRAILASMQLEGLVNSRQGSGTYAVGTEVRTLTNIALMIDPGLKIAEDPFVTRVVEEVLEAAQLAGVRCTVTRLREGHLDLSAESGAILFGKMASETVGLLGPKDPPVVCLFLDSVKDGDGRVSYLQLDDRKAGNLAASRLIDEGYSSLLFVGRLEIPASNSRYQGARDAAGDAGVDLQLVETPLNYLSGVKLGASLDLSSGDTALIATNDWLALGIRAGIAGRRDGLPAPIVSFDGLSITRDPLVNIESLEVPIRDMAADAIEELLRLSRPESRRGRNLIYSLRWSQ